MRVTRVSTHTSLQALRSDGQQPSPIPVGPVPRPAWNRRLPGRPLSFLGDIGTSSSERTLTLRHLPVTQKTFLIGQLTVLLLLAPSGASYAEDQLETPRYPEAASVPHDAHSAGPAPAKDEQDTDSTPSEASPAREYRVASDLPAHADVLSLTVSGGVSLGSYESGISYLLTEALRKSPGAAELKVVSGASAGSANALVAGTEACRTSPALPEDSLGYKVWVNVGLAELFDPARVTERNIFHRDALRTSLHLLEQEWQQGLPDDCDFVAGMSATREEGYEVHLAPQLKVPRQAEKFAIRIQGRGPGEAPLFQNYLDPQSSFERPILPFSDGSPGHFDQDMRAIEQVTFASAAFPVAFDASAVEHCITPGIGVRPAHSNTPPTCEEATRVDRFIDGGVFDNNPLGLAVSVATRGLVDSANGPAFRPIPSGGPSPGPKIVYGLIDPSIRNYPLYEAPTTETDEQRDPVLSLLARLGGNVLSSARGRELAQLADQQPEALKQLWLIESSYPPVSELLHAFFGFLERDFRDFDFHLGTYETYRELRGPSGSMLGVGPYLEVLDAHFSGESDNVPLRYRKLACILSVAEPEKHRNLQGLCGGAHMHNFRALLQVTFDRLWSNCRRVRQEQTSERLNMQCKRARGGLAVPLVDSRFTVRGARYQTDRESEFDYVMRLLADYEFHFKDLGLDKNEASKGRVRVRRQLEEMAEALANAQGGFANRTLVLTGARAVLNGIEYEPPKNRWYITIGSSLAAGHLRRLFDQRAFFFSADARVHRLRSLAEGHADEFSSTVSMGLDWMLFPLSGPVLQTSIGVRGGYQFAYSDAAGFDTCGQPNTSGDSRLCSQPVIHLPLTLTLLERLRVALTSIVYPIGEDWGHTPIGFEFDVGVELF